jgi:hypothetical protein
MEVRGKNPVHEALRDLRPPGAKNDTVGLSQIDERAMLP